MPSTLDNVKQTDVTVVLCTFNRQKMLRAALESLTSLRAGLGLRYDIVVVDDGSNDETSSVVQSIVSASSVKIRYIRQDNSGVAAARNTGIRHALGNWVAFFDDDQIADRDWLARLLEAAKSTGADCVGGPCLLTVPAQAKVELPPIVRKLLGERLNSEQIVGWRGMLDPRPRHSLPNTGNALVRRDLFDRIGLFSEGLRYGEDTQFFRRAQSKGARFATAPDAIVHHAVPVDRLTAKYALARTGLNAAVMGQIDIETGISRALWSAAMRFFHLLFWTVPGLVGFALVGNRSAVLGKRCSARFATRYLAAVTALVWRRLIGCSC